MKDVFAFLKDLRDHNTRDWYQANQTQYKQARKKFEVLVTQIAGGLKTFDDEIDVLPPKDFTFRIFRDVRFSNDKRPYKAHFSAFIAKGGRKSERAGYYVHLEPGKSFIGGGMYQPRPEVLLALRKDILADPEELKGILHDATFAAHFDGLYGETLKTAPRGFPKDFPDVHLLRHKHFVVTHPTEDDFWLQTAAAERAVEVFKVQYPLNRYLNFVASEGTGE